MIKCRCLPYTWLSGETVVLANSCRDKALNKEAKDYVAKHNLKAFTEKHITRYGASLTFSTYLRITIRQVHLMTLLRILKALPRCGYHRDVRRRPFRRIGDIYSDSIPDSPSVV